jgi:hypothetical protein
MGKRLLHVIGGTDSSEATRRLGDLRRTQPADATLRNLLDVLSAKLELCATLPVYEWEAGREGHAESATAFRDLAEAERLSCCDVIEQLRTFLDRRGGAQRGNP